MTQTEPKNCCIAHYCQYRGLVVDKVLDSYPDEIRCPQCGRIGKLVESVRDVSNTMGLPLQTIVVETVDYVWYAPQEFGMNVVM